MGEELGSPLRQELVDLVALLLPSPLHAFNWFQLAHRKHNWLVVVVHPSPLISFRNFLARPVIVQVLTVVGGRALGRSEAQNVLEGVFEAIVFELEEVVHWDKY